MRPGPCLPQRSPSGAVVCGEVATCTVHSPLAFIHGNESLPFSGGPSLDGPPRAAFACNTCAQLSATRISEPLGARDAGSRIWGASMAVTMNKTVCPKRLTCSDVWLSVARQGIDQRSFVLSVGPKSAWAMRWRPSLSPPGLSACRFALGFDRPWFGGGVAACVIDRLGGEHSWLYVPHREWWNAWTDA